MCATNRNPWQEVQEGRFREDLYYRLHVIPITLPPLRDRGNDIIEIAHALLGLMSLEEGKDFSRFSKEVLQLFESYSWPGNVRELQNIIRNIVVLNTAEEVTKEMVPPPINAIVGAEIASPMSIYPQLNTLTSTVNTSFVDEIQKDKVEPLWIVEKRAIQWAIDACDGNVPRAAGLLEVSPSTIYRKLQTWQETAGSREID